MERSGGSGGVVGHARKPVGTICGVLRRRSPGDVLTRLRDTTYLGSHPRAKGHRKYVDLTFHRNEIAVTAGRKSLAVIPWTSVSSLRSLPASEAHAAISAAHIVLLGALAALAPGAAKTAHLEVIDDGGTWLFAVPGLTAVELGAGLEPVRRACLPNVAARGGTGGEPAAAPTAVERLRTLDRLLSERLITEDEYKARRAVVLGET